jgi:hypothetical protein
MVAKADGETAFDMENEMIGLQEDVKARTAPALWKPRRQERLERAFRRNFALPRLEPR